MNKKKIIIMSVCIIGIILGTYIKVKYSPIGFRSSEYVAFLCDDGVHLEYYRGEDKDVVIPNYIGFFPVTVIGENCFELNDSIETVVIPGNVKKIGESAFEGCIKLKTVKAENVKSVDYLAFNDDWNLEIVELGDNLQTIGVWAFNRCHSLTYIPSKQSLKEIGDYAFQECEIEDPGDLTGIIVGDDVFKNSPWSRSSHNLDSVISNNYEEENSTE